MRVQDVQVGVEGTVGTFVHNIAAQIALVLVRTHVGVVRTHVQVGVLANVGRFVLQIVQWDVQMDLALMQ